MTANDTQTQTLERPEADLRIQPAQPWVTVVFDDPVNLMTYVTYVFQSYFGYSKAKAEKLMKAVHYEGKAIVSTGSREEMERDTAAMHSFGLWAQCRPGGSTA